MGNNKYNLVRMNALDEALSLNNRKFKKVYICEFGIFPCEAELKDLYMAIKDSVYAIIPTHVAIRALRSVDTRLVNVEHISNEAIRIGNELVEL